MDEPTGRSMKHPVLQSSSEASVRKQTNTYKYLYGTAEIVKDVVLQFGIYHVDSWNASRDGSVSFAIGASIVEPSKLDSRRNK